MEKNTEFICFTSAAGGAGCSGCAVGFARILSLMLKKNILYLSLDLLSEKMSYVSERTESTKRLLTSMMDYEEDFDKLFKEQPAKLEKIISEMSAGQKRSLAYRAKQLIADGGIDSRKTIQILEKCLGIELIER